MARNHEKGFISNHPVRMHRTLRALQVVDLRFADIGYIEKDAVSPEAGVVEGRAGLVYVDGTADVYEAKDLRAKAEDGGALGDGEDYRDFLRIICLSQHKSKKIIPRMSIDAHHLELGADTLFADRFATRFWDKDEGVPVPVIDLIYNSLDLQRAEQVYANQFGIVLPPSELMALKHESSD